MNAFSNDPPRAKANYKLKYFCEMCKKQCKDENGFKQHCNKEYHKQQMISYAQNAQAYIEQFSSDFEKGFFDLLKRFYPNQKVQANKVYKDYIHDRTHVHMNSTKWPTLGQFVEYLGQQNKVIVETDEQGPHITLIDRSPMAILESKKIEKQHQNQLSQKSLLEKRQNSRIQEIIQIENNIYEKNKSKLGQIKNDELPEDKQQNIAFEIKGKEKQECPQNKTSIFLLKSIENRLQSKPQDVPTPKQNKSEIDILLQEIKNNKKVKTPSEHLIQNLQMQKPKFNPGIIVKILSKNLKGIIKRIHDDYCADVQLLHSQQILKFDLTDLQTVVPKIDGTVMVLKQGQYFQKIGVLESLQKDNFSAAIQIFDDNVCLKLKYDEFSKIP